MTIRLVFLISALAMCACTRETPAPPAASTTAPKQALNDWTLPSMAGAAQPDLILAPDGRLLLSWISSLPGRRHALQFAAFDRTGKWQSAPRTIAVGNNMFVNWADTPHLAATEDGALWVHWLQKTADAPYAYDVMLSRSRDGGANWSAPIAVNDDDLPVEHGFVSLWPAADDSIGVAWLDGRKMGAAGHGGGHDAPAAIDAMMTLRSARFDANLLRSDESELDASTCDCCQTGAAVTANGPLLVYRDRTVDEIRDIYSTRLQGASWTAPKVVHVDNWKMPACPVNGPSAAVLGDRAVVAWYTAAAGEPVLKAARSSDSGDSFSAPIEIDRGRAVQGRVTVALDARQAWILWLREETAGQSLWLARYAPDLSRELQRQRVATLQGRGRGTGFPQLVLRDGAAHVVWTDLVDGQPHLQGAIIAGP